jgi:probable rRNA maturation factor
MNMRTFSNAFLTISFTQKTRREEVELKEMLPALCEVLAQYLKNNERWGGIKLSSKQNIEVSVTIVGRKAIKDLNRNFRNKDKVTDVLSFGIFDSLRAKDLKKIPVDLKMPHINLGDIIVCKEKAIKQAGQFNLSYEEEVIHLIVHGFLHVIGFDHEISDAEEKLMEKEEKSIISSLSRKLRK